MRSILVTGANSGVGLEVTRALLANDERVIMAVRDMRRGLRTQALLVDEFPAAQIRLEHVDLTDLRSVRALAAKDLEVDVLVNNAGIAFEPMLLTSEGVLSQFAANHLGHFVLTALLFDRLATRLDPRVVTVTSTLAKKGRVDLENLDGSRGFQSARAYAQSKVANVLFGAELDRRVRARGSAVKSVLVHPGVPATPMQQKATGWIGVIARTAAAVVGTPPTHGAAAVLEAALGRDVKSGDLVGPGRRIADPPRKETPWPTMRDAEGAARLWERSEALGEVRFLG